MRWSAPLRLTWVHIGWDGAGSDNRTKRDVQQRNVTYALDAVEAAAALGCHRFLFTGSQAEYGVWHRTVAEDTPCHPVSEYGKAKVDFCEKAKILCKQKNMEYIHTRIYSVYGPGDHPWSLVQSCLRTWQEGGSMKLGECTQNWNFLYIDDAAAALVSLLTEVRISWKLQLWRASAERGGTGRPDAGYQPDPAGNLLAACQNICGGNL